MKVRAPATTANLGPGFDVAGAAFDLWNEVEVGPANGAVDTDHLAVQAFAKFTDPERYSFHFTDRIALTIRVGYPEVTLGCSFLL